MWKTVLAGTAALAIAGTSLVYAQQGPGGPGRDGPRWRPNAEDISALGDAKIASIHAGLKLTAEQEKSWRCVIAFFGGTCANRSQRPHREDRGRYKFPDHCR